MTDYWGYMAPIEAGPCIQPSVGEFRGRFPEFADLSDTQVEIAIADASCWTDNSWPGVNCADCTTAMAYLAAHYLALGLHAAATLPATLPASVPGEPAIIAGGQVTSIRFESMGVSFAPPMAVGGGGGGSFGTSGIGDSFALAATPYGQRYLELVKVNKPAILVV